MEKNAEKKQEIIVLPQNPNRRPTRINSNRTNALRRYEDKQLIHFLKYGYWR